MGKKLSGTFDKGVNFSEANKIFTENISKLISKNIFNSYDQKRLSFNVVCLIQLKNGSRISETITAIKMFLKNPDCKIVTITIAKRKDGATRKIKLPDLITRGILEIVGREIKDDTIPKLSNKVRAFLINHYGWNTHSLRYALINYLAIERREPINLVSKLVGHKNMNQIMAYTQNKHVDELLFSVDD